VSESRAMEIVIEVGSRRCRRVYCETRVSSRGDGDGDGVKYKIYKHTVDDTDGPRRVRSCLYPAPVLLFPFVLA
jgi:hypothetical protein